MEIIKVINRGLGGFYEEQIGKAKEIMARGIEIELKKKEKKEEEHVIVTLGYVLNEEGEIQETLRKRLELTLEMSRIYPRTKIIVSGGVPKEGVTESHVMKEWLIERGVDKNLIYVEDQSKDTVDNGLRSMEIIKDMKIRHLSLVTSASHMRRALVIFNIVKAINDVNIEIEGIASMDFDNEEEMEEVLRNEKIVIYRDLIRASGIYSFPQILR